MMKSNILLNFSVDKDNNKIIVEREFAAPVSKVWAAWTDRRILDQWWAPKPWKARTKTMDFKEGGFWLYAMIGPDGTEQWSRADYKTIKPLKSFSGLDAFCDEKGNIDHKFPVSLWNVRFISESSDTTVVSVEIHYDNLSDLEKFMEMGFKEGFTSAMENLDGLL